MRVNALNWEEEVFYRRLLSYVDDYGRCEAHAALLRAALYPLKLDQVREANVERLLAAVERARLVRLYTVSGKRYLEVSDFRQQVRSNSKHPAPDAQQVDSFCAAIAKHPIANEHLGVSVSVSEGVAVVGDGGGPPVGGRSSRASAARPSSLSETEDYFVAQGSIVEEAAVFFDHFEANGWRQGGKTPMRDWQAAARNWIRRSSDGSRGAAAGLARVGGGKNLLNGAARRGGVSQTQEEPRVSLPVAGLDEAMAEVGLGPDGQPLAGVQGGEA